MSKQQTSSGLNATRQMLDDLDALMERMLALPMDDAEPTPPKRPALAATLTVLPTTHEAEAEKAPTALQGPHVNFSALSPKPAETATADTEMKGAERSDEAEVPPPLVIRRLDTVVPPATVPPVRSSTSLFWLPLVWINQGFDQATRLLGPLGWVLRSSPGRWLLGLTGLALFGLAAAWLLRDLMTW